MIILDTNVLSAVMNPEPEPTILEWLDRQARISVWTTCVTVFEIELGIILLSPGRRRTYLETALMRALAEKIEDRIAPFDTAAAKKAAELAADRRHAGRIGELRDTMIAGIAIARHATVATRNIRHFEDLPVPVVNPWGLE